MISEIRTELRKFGAFQLVGVVTTAVSLPLMAVLDGAGVPYPVYTTLNYAVGLVAGFFLNFRFAFGDQGASRTQALVRYVAGFLGLWALVQGLQYLLIDQARWDRWWGVGLGMVVYAVAGYLMSRHWIFAAPRRPPLPSVESPGGM